MALFRAGPWGTLNDPYQPRPPAEVFAGERAFDTPDIGFYPVNVANNESVLWNAFYSSKQQICPRPTTLTAESFFGPKQLEMTPEGECSTEYYWANPSSPFYGELRIKLSTGGVWEYTQLISGAGFGVNTALPIGVDQTQEDYEANPTGLYDQGGGPYSYNVITP